MNTMTNLSNSGMNTRFMKYVGVFYTSKILGGQDHVFLFRGGLANNKSHYGYPGLGPSLEVIALRPAV
jgi:hypothetical protein